MKTKLCTALVAIAISGPATAQEVTLRLHHFLSAEAPIHAGVFEVWKERVEEQSEGRIEVQLYPSMQLGGKPPQLFDQARDGIVDISWTLLGYTPGRFPVSEVFELPFVAGSATETTMALQDFQEAYLSEELDDVHPLLLHAPAAYKFHMRGEPVESLEALAGKKVRAPSRTMTEGLEALGATAVGMPVPEVAQALTTGVIDGAVIPWEVFGSLRIEDMAKYHTEIGEENGGLSTSVMALVMNKRVYEGLPDDLKAVIDANSGANLAPLAGEVLDAAEAEEREKALAAGGEAVVIPEADLEAWKSATQPVIDAWVEATPNGAEILEAARAAIDAQRGE